MGILAKATYLIILLAIMAGVAWFYDRMGTGFCLGVIWTACLFEIVHKQRTGRWFID